MQYDQAKQTLLNHREAIGKSCDERAKVHIWLYHANKEFTYSS